MFSQMRSRSAKGRLSAPPTVLACAAHGMIEFLENLSLDPDSVLSDVALTRPQVTDGSSRIPLPQYCRLFARTAQRAHHDNVGLDFAALFRPEELGFLGYLAVSAPTLGQSLRTMTECLPLHQEGTIFELEKTDTGLMALTYMVLDGSLADRRHDAEFSLAVALHLFHAALGSRWAPEEVHFMHPRPDDARAHELAFGAPIYFQQPCNRVLFDPQVLGAAMPRADRNLHDLISRTWAEPNHLAARQPDLLARARSQISRTLESGDCELAKIANLCGVPAWTLKRRLNEAGLTFQKLVTDTRRDMAIEYLCDYRLSVTETALALGYSETSAFSRAFRQWTGQSPSDYRRAP